MFFGCIPMGLATIINGLLIFGIPLWGKGVIVIAEGLWWLEAALSVLCGIAIPFMMFTRHGDSQTYEHFYLSLQAACAGLCVAIGSVFMAQEEIDSGRLVAPFGFMRDGSEYFLLSPLPFESDPRRATFLQWMRQQMHHAPP